MQLDGYAESFNRLREYCRTKDIPVQTIKSVARRKYPDRRWTHSTWYQPLTDPKAIERAVHWVLGVPDVFMVTTGEPSLLSEVLAAAASFEQPPPDAVMEELVRSADMEPLFT
jgi:hypothetical protein